MKKFASILVLSLLCFALVGQSAASAISVTPQPTAPTPPNILITSITNSGLLDAEIYNQTDVPINLSGWQLRFEVTNCGATTVANVPAPSGWILSKSYLNFRQGTTASPHDYSVLFNFSPNIPAGCVTAQKLVSVQILQGTTVEQAVQVSDNTKLPAQHRQRDNAASSTRTITGDFLKDYVTIPAKDYDTGSLTGAPLLYSDPLYSPPANDGGLQILEVLPNARNCAPNDTTSPDCADYVKLYNSGAVPIDLTQYRLRIGYKGQGISVTNTFHFGAALQPGKYFTLVVRDDGQPLSITDTGNFIWLEDSYGTKTYGDIIQYPDASSTTKIGQAWAYDGTTWRWTSAPHPSDASYFPPDPVEPAPTNTTSYTPCAANQYRNPDTHRCRNIVVSASTLVPCKSGQVRSPDTNRCRSVLASSSSLQPCKAGQTRNPNTNRCKSAAASSSSLKPCQDGWTRNPETNRCRKGSVLGDATTKIQDVKSPVTANNTRWLLAGLVVLGALAYGAYEWRQELTLKFIGLKKSTAAIGRQKK